MMLSRPRWHTCSTLMCSVTTLHVCCQDDDRPGGWTPLHMACKAPTNCAWATFLCTPVYVHAPTLACGQGKNPSTLEVAGYLLCQVDTYACLRAITLFCSV